MRLTVEDGLAIADGMHFDFQVVQDELVCSSDLYTVHQIVALHKVTGRYFMLYYQDPREYLRLPGDNCLPPTLQPFQTDDEGLVVLTEVEPYQKTITEYRPVQPKENT